MNLKLILTIVLGVKIMSCSTLDKNEFQNLSYKNLELNNFNYDDVKHKNLSQELFNEDLLMLRYAIDKAYGAKGTLPESIFKKVDKDIKALNYLPNTKELCLMLGKILSQFTDNHLQVKFKGRNCYKRKVKLVDVGKNKNDLKDKSWKVFKDNDIYTIAITGFPSGDWPGFLDFVEEAKNKAKAIILDLRGNGGGDDSISYKMVELLAGQSVASPYAPSAHRNTPETLTIWVNYLRLIKSITKDKNNIKQLDKYLDETKAKLKLALDGKLEEFTFAADDSNLVPDYDHNLGYKNLIYILQDKRTASSGESTIGLFEMLPNVKKVGYNTAGMLHFGNIGWVELPNSRIQIQMPSKANNFKDGRFIEFTGIKPDIPLKEGQDAYEYVINESAKHK